MDDTRVVALAIPQLEDMSKRISVMGKKTPEEMFGLIAEPQPVSSVVNKVIEVEGVFSSVIDVANPETGEIKTTPLLYIITKDGALVSRSNTVIRAVMTFFAFMGPPSTWKTAKKVEFYQTRGAGGQTYYNLRPGK